jgi:hypothetical protein
MDIPCYGDSTRDADSCAATFTVARYAQPALAGLRVGCDRSGQFVSIYHERDQFVTLGCAAWPQRTAEIIEQEEDGRHLANRCNHPGS